MPYTFLNNAAAETLLGHSLEFMAREIGKTPECGSVRAVILDGGCGRGEGGATPEGALCNDLDFFVIPHDGISTDSLQSAFRHLGRKRKPFCMRGRARSMTFFLSGCLVLPGL
ncbi:MAG: hypothetical protein ACI4UV_01265 [Victivallales bacterium]